MNANKHLKLKDTETLYLSCKEIQRTHSYKSKEQRRKGTTDTRTLRARTDYICPRLNPRTNIVVLLATRAFCLFHLKATTISLSSPDSDSDEDSSPANSLGCWRIISCSSDDS
jgi:hypothetical protein